MTERPEEDSDSVDSFLRAVALEQDAATMAQPFVLPLRTGTVVAKRYRLLRPLGEGGMGVVWAAVHTITRLEVALKFLKGSPLLGDEPRRRFLREARAVCAVRHPNVVEVTDVFELEDGTPVMVMELLSGETLAQRLTREKRLSLQATAAIMLPVVSAVGSAHALGIVHRDLKPDNVFLVADSTSENVKVLDFGLAKLMSGPIEKSASDVQTSAGAMLGTPCYMAPEQATGERDIDHRADIWALGVTLYECLTGERPVKASNVGQMVLTLMKSGIVPLAEAAPELPRDVTAIIDRMLNLDRTARPDSLREVGLVLAQHANASTPTFGEPLMQRDAQEGLPEDGPTASARRAPTGEVASPWRRDEGASAPGEEAGTARNWKNRLLLASAIALTGLVAVVVLPLPRVPPRKAPLPALQETTAASPASIPTREMALESRGPTSSASVEITAPLPKGNARGASSPDRMLSSPKVLARRSHSPPVSVAPSSSSPPPFGGGLVERAPF